MKRTDIAMIIFITAVSLLVAFFVTRAFFSGIVTEPVKVKTIDKIEATVEEPDAAIFNENAINPTSSITLGADTSAKTTQAGTETESD